MACCLLAFLLQTSEGRGNLPQLLPGSPSLLMAQARAWVSAVSIALPTAPCFPASTSIFWYCNSPWDLLNVLLSPIYVYVDHEVSTVGITCTSAQHSTVLNQTLVAKGAGNNLLIIISLTLTARVSCLLCLQERRSWACWPSSEPRFPHHGDTWRVSAVCRWSN